jgi:2-oxoisovalerate dehydrogenase E2 component (dihydrolipoyl transacylase)
MSTATAKEQLFRLPDLGEGLTEAEILEWRVQVGDAVEVDQVVVEVETAKAAVEIPVPYTGTVLTLHCEVGTVLDVGAPLISITASGTGTDPATAADAPSERHREEEQAGSGNVLVGYGTEHASARRRARVKPAPPAPNPASSATTTRVISPVIRKLARDNGVDLGALTAGQPDGVIRGSEVATAIEQRRQKRAAAGNAAPVPLSAPDSVERIPLRGVRRAVADKLVRSRSEIPDATTWVDVDATGLVEAKDALKAASPDQPIGLLALLARICVAGLKRFPDLNSFVDIEEGEILRYLDINLGFATQTDRGLVVPVIRDAGRMNMAQLQAETARLTALARKGTLPPTQLTGGTFTLNNYGVFGVDGSTPIINYPEAAMLGVGRIVDKPWVVGGELVVRKVTQLSFTFDHRVCDGGVAGGFLRYVADCVERPKPPLFN